MEKFELNKLNKKFESPEQEINFLREKLANQEKQLQKKGHESYEVREKIDQSIDSYKKNNPEEIYQRGVNIPEKFRDEIVLELSPESHDEKMSELISIAQTKGVLNALDIVSKLNDPHLDDDFHRFLVQFVGSGYELKGLKDKTPLANSIKRVLYEVTLPSRDDEGDNKTLQELVSLMDQFYSGMMSISSGNKNDYLTLEITNAIGSRQFIFYISVSLDKRDMFEKQLLSVFPDAKLFEQKDDFNIFNHKGYSVGAYAKLTDTPAKPIKMYEEFNNDPLNVILNVFSKLDKEDEGAALQLVFKPNGNFYEKNYLKAINKLEKGEKASDELHARNTTGDKFVRGLSSIISGGSKKEKTDDNVMPEIDNTLIELVRNKVSSQIVSANVRIVSSAQSEGRASSILSDLKSAFNQFNNPSSNSLEFVDIFARGRKKFFRQFTYRQFDQDIDTPLNIKEFSTLIHLPSKIESASAQLKTSGFTTAAAPIELGSEGVILGINEYQGNQTEIRFSETDRMRHSYVIGQTGTGKTNILEYMIIQDIQNGEGVCMIDPHGDFIQDILANIPQERIDDVIYFDPAYSNRSISLNMLEFDPQNPNQKTFVVNELFNIFMKLYGDNPESMGPMFEQYFRNATMLVLEDPESGTTLLDVSRVLSDEKYRSLKLSRCKNPIVKQFWEEIAVKAGGEAALQNIVPYITSKFDVFLANDIMRPVIAQEKSSFDFRKIMDEKKILLVNLSKGRLGDINSNLIGLIIVGKILMASLSRADSFGKEFPPFYLYIDEFQNITTDSISTILSEARKYKLSLNIAHQYIAQLNQSIRDAVFGNVGSIMSFRVGSDDAEFLQNQFAPTFSAEDLMNIDNYNAYVKMLSKGQPVKPFSLKTLKSPDGNKEQVEGLKQLSYQKYGKDRLEVENEINQKYVKLSATDDRSVRNNPFNNLKN
jgi:type IV secretory pathway TraG/TraD family ATPase VirD4